MVDLNRIRARLEVLERRQARRPQGVRYLTNDELHALIDRDRRPGDKLIKDTSDEELEERIARYEREALESERQTPAGSETER